MRNVRRAGASNAGGLAVLLLCAHVHATLRLPTFVASSMALQRAPQSSRLWGFAEPGANVSVALDGIPCASNITQADGNWTIDLPPQQASVNRTIVVSDGETTLTLDDIAFGDVWLCSGQSNSA